VKNDAYTHIFEIAFPPVRTAPRFAACFAAVDAIVRTALAEVGLRIQPGGVLPELKRFLFRPATSACEARVERGRRRPLPQGRFTHKDFWVFMAATQVHLGILSDELYERLPAIYELQYLVPLLFPGGGAHRGEKVHCMRPLLYRDGFVPEHAAFAVPGTIPTSRQAYEAFLAGSPAWRDVTFVAPRPALGTVELRAACSQPTLERMLDLVALQMGIAEMSTWREASGLDPAALFYEACERGTVPPAIAAEHWRALATALHGQGLPADLKPHLVRVLARLASATVGIRSAA
jgi:hypothetical protein